MIIAGLLLTSVFIYASCCYYGSNKKKLSLRDYKLKWKL